MGNTHQRVEINVPNERIADLLCVALETPGSTDYWSEVGELDDKKVGKAAIVALGDQIRKFNRYIWLPLVEGCGVEIIENYDKPVKHRLDVKAIQRGLKLMAETQPHHFADMLKEDDDMTTADVFLQLCVLGEVRYG